MHPICIDHTNAFIKNNEIPVNSAYHTFLVDSDNKVLAIGNPVRNPKIKDLYKEIILKTDADTSISVLNFQSKPIGLISRDETLVTDFQIINNDSITLHIQSLISSCSCIEAIANTMTIPPNESAFILIHYRPDSINNEFNQYVDIFYKEKEKPERLIAFGYIE